jgi:hypothetical protein
LGIPWSTFAAHFLGLLQHPGQAQEPRTMASPVARFESTAAAEAASV